jgi:phosphate transport system permease protein
MSLAESQAPPPARPATATQSGSARRPGDLIFSGLAKAAGVSILVVLAGVALFLVVESVPAFTAPAEEIPGGEGFISYVVPLVYGTVVVSLIALVVATPLAVGIALFISHFAPRRAATGLGYLVDLLAAVPSVIYGLWGLAFLAPKLTPLYAWLAENLGFVPLFGAASSTGRTLLTAGIVVAVMILPIMTAITREVFLQTPRLHEEAALALGATRWEMIRMSVLPYGRAGIISAAMLGLGRALGETLAVTLILSVGGGVTLNLIGQSNPATIPANIALNFPESSGIDVNVLIASGLVLFVITFFVNAAARAIIARRSEFSGAAG